MSFKKFFYHLDKLKIIGWNSLDITCKNERAIFTCRISFIGISVSFHNDIFIIMILRDLKFLPDTESCIGDGGVQLVKFCHGLTTKVFLAMEITFLAVVLQSCIPWSVEMQVSTKILFQGSTQTLCIDFLFMSL